MSRADRLWTFLEPFQGKPIVYDSADGDDCTALCARWVEHEAGFSVPMEPYHSRMEAEALIERHGLVALWDAALADLPVFEVETPSLGDVGLIERMPGVHFGVIFAHNGYSFWRTGEGIRWFSPRPSMIQRVWSF
ncbi:hypothetical protein [uncultured Nitratireductor sp.]|uniref:DUF6950 family protein n=1 Tax=uncultured Nitratireductor sp. TaxID=520953 RepID=UPI002605499C|nr:hypothetical protein [uncultured Nitratireductor sp.]